LRTSLAAAALACLLSAPSAFAQSATDMTSFSAACAAGGTFLLAQYPEDTPAEPILTPLCACLDTTFSTLPQADVDMLASDLRGEGTEEAHTAHGNYEALANTARDGVNACFATPEVVAAVEANVPAEPAAPVEPATP
jgi:hypothetical protein